MKKAIIILIVVLVLLLLGAGVYIGVKEFNEYKENLALTYYQQGGYDGRLQLISTIMEEGAVPFFNTDESNETKVEWATFEQICSGGEG